MQQNQWDYAQQNRDWAALETAEIDTLDHNFEKTTIASYKSVKPLQWHFKQCLIVLIAGIIQTAGESPPETACKHCPKQGVGLIIDRCCEWAR